VKPVVDHGYQVNEDRKEWSATPIPKGVRSEIAVLGKVPVLSSTTSRAATRRLMGMRKSRKLLSVPARRSQRVALAPKARYHRS
jgi:hypothetical protein